MKRTSVMLEESLLEMLKKEAKREGVSFREILQRLVREGLRARAAQARSAETFSMKVFSGSGAGVKIDLGDREALYDALEEDGGVS